LWVLCMNFHNVGSSCRLSTTAIVDGRGRQGGICRGSGPCIGRGSESTLCLPPIKMGSFCCRAWFSTRREKVAPGINYRRIDKRRAWSWSLSLVRLEPGTFSGFYRRGVGRWLEVLQRKEHNHGIDDLPYRQEACKRSFCVRRWSLLSPPLDPAARKPIAWLPPYRPAFWRPVACVIFHNMGNSCTASVVTMSVDGTQGARGRNGFFLFIPSCGS
jgi:hypothetical protein